MDQVEFVEDSLLKIEVIWSTKADHITCQDHHINLRGFSILQGFQFSKSQWLFQLILSDGPFLKHEVVDMLCHLMLRISNIISN